MFQNAIVEFAPRAPDDVGEESSREGAVVREPLRVACENEPQLVERILALVLGRQEYAFVELVQIVDDAQEHVGLAGEVAIEGGDADAKTLGQVAVGEPLHALLGDEAEGFLDDLSLSGRPRYHTHPGRLTNAN